MKTIVYRNFGIDYAFVPMGGPMGDTAVHSGGGMVLDLSNLSILVVDDSRSMRKILRAVLEGFGISEIIEADSPAAGLDQLERIQPDLIITDWVMKDASGIDLVKQLRAHNNPSISMIPVIMLTSYSEKSRVVAGIYSGIHDFVTKPIVPKLLYSRIVDIINNPRPFVRGGGFFGPEPRSAKFFDVVETERKENPNAFSDVDKSQVAGFEHADDEPNDAVYL